MITIAAPAKPSPFAVFCKRSFTLLWVGQLTSTIGSGMTAIAASILVYRVTGAALSVGLMLMASAPSPRCNCEVAEARFFLISDLPAKRFPEVRAARRPPERALG